MQNKQEQCPACDFAMRDSMPVPAALEKGTAGIRGRVAALFNNPEKVISLSLDTLGIAKDSEKSVADASTRPEPCPERGDICRQDKKAESRRKRA